MANKKLNEGMRAGDLNNLILPLLSVDEYVSKINEDAVAIGFYVHDEDAANDLNRFLQKSPVTILSSEVSPAPDQHGYFIVFIEMMDNKELASNIEDILKEIEPLCEIERWKMRVRKSEHLLPFDKETFQKALKNARKTDQDAVIEYLVPSVLGNATLYQRMLTLESMNGIRNQYHFVAFDRVAKLMIDHKLNEAASGYDLNVIARCNRIRNMLGENWVATSIGPYVLIQNVNSDHGLLIKI